LSRLTWWRGGPEPRELDAGPAYARWAATYPRDADNELMRLEEREVLRLLPPLAGARVVDLGCGAGRYLCRAAAGGAGRRVGVDASAAMLARAREAGGLLVRAELPAVPFRNAAFDVAVCALVVGHLRHLGPGLAEIARVLRPGGTLVYSDMHPEGARRGWRRTFVADDATEYAVRHFVHALDEHRAACAAAGLVIEEIAEPRVEHVARWRGTPAALVVRARRVAAGPA
jgi:SAM-dependent methyltransferase